MSPEARKKISDSLKKRWQDPEFRNSHIENSKKALEKAHNTPLTDDVRKKLSDSSKKRWSDPKMREVMCQNIAVAKKGQNAGKNNPMFGKKQSSKTRQKISEKQKESWKREDTREKYIKALKARTPTFIGKQHSQETKDVIAKKAKGRWANSEWREDIQRKRLAIFRDPQWKKRQSEARKKLWQDPKYRERVLSAFQNKQPTSLEVLAQSILDSIGIEYEFQKLIDRAIIDFYIPDLNLCLEVDGRYWHDKPEVKDRDRRRDHWLISKGYKVVRICEYTLKADPYDAVVKALESAKMA